MDTYELIQRLSVALAIGLIIGIERGWKQRSEPEGESAAGLRMLSVSDLPGLSAATAFWRCSSSKETPATAYKAN
jgi:hypothetical protein